MSCMWSTNEIQEFYLWIFHLLLCGLLLSVKGQSVKNKVLC